MFSARAARRVGPPAGVISLLFNFQERPPRAPPRGTPTPSPHEARERPHVGVPSIERPRERRSDRDALGRSRRMLPLSLLKTSQGHPMVRRRRPLPASPRSLRARDRRARTAPRSAASRAPPLARGRAPRANPRALVRGAPGRTPRVRAIRPRVRARPPPGANEIRSIARSRGADPSLAPSRHTRGRGLTLGVYAPASRAIPRLSRSSPSTRNPDPLHPPSPTPDPRLSPSRRRIKSISSSSSRTARRTTATS